MNFIDIFSKKSSNITFHQNPSSGSRVVSCGRTDRQTDVTKLTDALWNFAKAPKGPVAVFFRSVKHKKYLRLALESGCQINLKRWMFRKWYFCVPRCWQGTRWEVWVPHSKVTQDSSFLECYTVPTGKQYQSFENTGSSKSLCAPDDGHHRIHTEFGPCYTEHGLREQSGVSINVWRLAGDTLNITCNFLYCNHQMHRDFLITLYNEPLGSRHPAWLEFSKESGDTCISVPQKTFILQHQEQCCHLKTLLLPNTSSIPSICSPQKLFRLHPIISILTCALVFYDQNMR